MLQLKNNIFENIETTPKEHYTFQFDPSAIVPVEKKYIGLMKKTNVSFYYCWITSHNYRHFFG